MMKALVSQFAGSGHWMIFSCLSHNLIFDKVLPSVPEKLKSLKHDMGSATERKSVNNFQKTENTMPIAVSEMSNTANYNNSGKEVFDVLVHQKDGEIDETTNKTVSISPNISEELNKEDTDNGDQHKPQIEESSFIRLCAENINQDIALVLPNETGSSISPKPAAVKEQNDSMSTVGSSHSRNTTPDNSFYSRPNDGENEMLSRLNPSESNQNHLKTHIDSSKDVSENNQDLHGDFNQPPLHSNSNSLKVSMKDKAMAIIHYKASDKPGQNVYLKSTPVSDKEASPDIKDLKAPTLSPLRDSRLFKRNQEFISKQNINMLKPNDISSDKGLSVAKSDTSRVKFRSSNLPDHTKESNTLTSLSTSLVKLNSLMLKSGTAKGTKIAMVAECSPKSPLKKAWIDSATEKNDSSAVPMKRKIFEVPAAENFEENVEECVNNLNSTLTPELGGITTGIERLEPYEKDETTIKAEFYRNKLEDVSGRLIKQQEEAKNLLFRVAAGNNSNKQLKQKYQRLDEKISF